MDQERGATPNRRRVKWNGTVRALPLNEQLRAADLPRCEILSVTPPDYNKWLGSPDKHPRHEGDGGGRRREARSSRSLRAWLDTYDPELPGDPIPLGTIGFDADDFFRIAAALGWSRLPRGMDSLRVATTVRN